MEDVKEYLNKLLKNNDTVVVSLSGGPDSMCLFNLLLDVKKDIKIIAAHINHNVRSESKDEELFVKNYVEKRNVIFETMKIDKYCNENFHKEARDIRYDYMDKIIKKYHANYLLTAHHGDDLIESILMRLVRGSSFLGYSGFKKETDFNSYKILRPLINKSKKEIEEYNIKNKIPFAIDKTNISREYTRNRYRMDILPFLHNENSNVIERFNKFSNLIIKYDSFLKENMLKYKKKILIDNYLLIDKFLNLDDLIQKSMLEDILYNIYVNDVYLLNDKHIELIYSLINSKKKNSYIELPNKVLVRKEYNRLIFNANLNKKERNNIEFNDYYEDEQCIIKKIDKSEINTNFIIRLDSKDINLPLKIVNRENGMKMYLNNGHKKINDIFIDSKVSKTNRDNLPILVDKNGEILWLPGLKKSKFAKDKDEKCDIILEYCLKEENNEKKY